MAKEVKRFSTVKEFDEATAAFKESKDKLDSNKKWFEKRHGEKGGTERLPDGKLIFTAKEANGKFSSKYKEMLEELEALILEGKMHQMTLGNATKFMLKLREKWSKAQMAGQVIKAEVKAGTKTESRSQAGLVKVVGS